MAERRMFAKAIIDSDAFLDMPVSSQLLYFHLAMRADDDGFVNAPKKIMRMIGANDGDANILLAKRFILAFDNGVIVIKHWRIHNYIRKDMYKPTAYEDEKAMLRIKADGSYTESVTDSLQVCNETVTQDRLGKDRLGKVSLGKGIEDTPTRHKYGAYENVFFTDEEFAKLKEEFPNDWADRIERLSEYIASSGKKYKSHLATIRAWARKDKSEGSGNIFLDILKEEQSGKGTGHSAAIGHQGSISLLLSDNETERW